jgi:plasmid stabilization system protein ParE
MKKYRISWSPLAEESYLETISQIMEKWTIKEAEGFEAKVNSVLEKLKSHKHLCPSSDKQSSLRRCVITPQTSLIYQIKNDVIELVTFFDNRSAYL